MQQLVNNDTNTGKQSLVRYHIWPLWTCRIYLSILIVSSTAPRIYTTTKRFKSRKHGETGKLLGRAAVPSPLRSYRADHRSKISPKLVHCNEEERASASFRITGSMARHIYWPEGFLERASPTGPAASV